jgi:hypothetical protein
MPDLSEAEKRQKEALEILKTDRLFDTYESPVVRELIHRRELLSTNAFSIETSDDPEENARAVVEIDNILAEIRSEQKKDDIGKIGVKYPVIPIMVVKPSPDLKDELNDLEAKIVAEEAERLLRDEAEVILNQLRAMLKTRTMVFGSQMDPDEAGDAIHELLVEHLMQLEGRDDDSVSEVSPFDAELKLTEEEVESITPTAAMEGAELAEAMMLRKSNERKLIESKKRKLIASRKKEAAKRREVLSSLDSERLIEDVAKVEIARRAIMNARTISIDYWLALCVRNPREPIKVNFRGEVLERGWRPFFHKVEDVRNIHEINDDFYKWLIERKSRLDVLTDEDLRGLADYGPFRQFAHTMLELRRGLGPLAALFGTGADGATVGPGAVNGDHAP